MTKEKTKEDKKNVGRINSGMRQLSHNMWEKVEKANFRSFTQFDKMFWDVTNRAWLSIEHSTFEDKLEFATLYWKDYEEKNLVRSKWERARQSQKPALSAAPTPTLVNSFEWTGVSFMVAFRLGYFSYPFGLPCAVCKALRPHSGHTTLIGYSFV